MVEVFHSLLFPYMQIIENISLKHNTVNKNIMNILLCYTSEMKPLQSKKGGNNQEWIQSSTTPDPRYHIGK